MKSEFRVVYCEFPLKSALPRKSKWHLKSLSFFSDRSIPQFTCNLRSMQPTAINGQLNSHKLQQKHRLIKSVSAAMKEGYFLTLSLPCMFEWEHKIYNFKLVLVTISLLLMQAFLWNILLNIPYLTPIFEQNNLWSNKFQIRGLKGQA